MLVHDETGEIDLKTPMEARLLAIFRALALIRLLISLLFLALPGEQLDALTWMRLIPVFEAAFLLAYLSLPPLKARLGRTYLPIAIVWATVMPLLVQNLSLLSALDLLTFDLNGVPQFMALENTFILGIINQSVLVLLVPLIVVGWAYSRTVLTLYVAAIFVCDLLMSALLFRTYLTLFLLAFALIIFRTLLHAVVGIMINQIVSIQLEQQRRLVAANAQLREYAAMREQLATSRERNRIARELHDTLAHTLSAATVQLEAVSIIWEQQPQKAQQMVTKSAAMMRDGLAETRRALQALRAGSLEDESLVDAIQRLAASLMTRYPVTIGVRADAPLALDHAATEHGLYRIVQEAMFNAARHGGAKVVTVTLNSAARGLVITVVDDGGGFDVQAASAKGHFGLRGMQERAQHIGATLDIRSRDGAGTTVTIRLDEKASDATADL